MEYIYFKNFLKQLDKLICICIYKVNYYFIIIKNIVNLSVMQNIRYLL